MSTKAASPTASILRNSRFFSLPHPLPLPDSEALGYQRNTRTSPTATLPWPVQQAITTTPAAHAHGDWGLKRPLPTRITQKTSTPIFKVNAVDTRESITDYSSATDHAITLQKLQELNLPVTVPPARLDRGFKTRYLDPFQPQLDNTDSKASVRDNNLRRWKFKGPSLSRISEGDFNAYVQRELKGRKIEFMAFLRRRAREYLAMERRVNASSSSTNAAIAASEEAQNISEHDVEMRIQQWQRTLDHGSILYSLITEFLDLPATVGPNEVSLMVRSREGEEPASTHPSAGLSYLRSDAFLSNHPILGPQNTHSPIEARSMGHVAKLDPFVFTGLSNYRVGVAGVVAADPAGIGGLRARSVSRDGVAEIHTHDKGGSTIGVSVPGGNRIWVNPTKLQIASNGRVKMEVYNSDSSTIAIHAGQVGTVEEEEVVPGRNLATKRPIRPGPGSGAGARQQRSPFFNALGDSTGALMRQLEEHYNSRPVVGVKGRS